MMSMPRSQNVNDALTVALQPYANAEAVLLGITSSLGVPPGEALNAVEYPVRGFFLRANNEILSFYAVTPGRFVVYEMAANGDSLTLTFPISRVRRVVEESRGGEVTVTVEVDADRRTHQVEGEYLEADISGGPEGQRGGRFQGTHIETFAVYRISAKLPQDTEDAAEADQLWDFAIALRNAVGQ